MELDKERFEQLIVETDSNLAQAGVPIPARPIQAILAVLKKYGTSGPIAHPLGKNLGFPVGPLNLGDHVNAWYGKQYGNKIKIDPSPGRFPLLIEGAPYQCRIPLVIGGALILASKGTFQDKRILNAVDHITDLPTMVRERLSGKTENEIQAIFCTCIEVSKELGSRKTSLHASAQTDMRISSDLLCGYNVNSSMSAWHSLQLAEKVLKQYISVHEKPPFTHDITKLVTIAAEYGYQIDSRLDLLLFSFGASTRYEPQEISVDRAVQVNHEAWRIAFNVLKQS